MNIQGLLKQAQQMQTTMAKIEKELNETSYFGSASGDAVKVEVKGSYEVVSIEIEDELLDKDSKEMLQDLLLVATNNALSEAKNDRESKMAGVTQGVKMPGMF